MSLLLPRSPHVRGADLPTRTGARPRSSSALMSMSMSESAPTTLGNQLFMMDSCTTCVRRNVRGTNTHVMLRGRPNAN